MRDARCGRAEFRVERHSDIKQSRSSRVKHGVAQHGSDESSKTKQSRRSTVWRDAEGPGVARIGAANQTKAETPWMVARAVRLRPHGQQIYKRNGVGMAKQKLPRAISKEGKIFGGVSCFVLEDGDRVLIKRSVVQMLSGNPNGKDADLERYIERLPNGSALLARTANKPFCPPGGGVGHGVRASTVAQMLRLYAEAWSSGVLRANQLEVAQRAVMMLSHLSEIGIIALVDEATGYQSVRPKDELNKTLLAMIREDRDDVDPVYKSLLVKIAKLKRFPYFGAGTPPPWAPTVANIVVTCIWGEEGRQKLRVLNPDPNWGHRDTQHFDDKGKKLLQRTLGIAEALAHSSKSWTHWKNQMESYFRGSPVQEWMF